MLARHPHQKARSLLFTVAVALTLTVSAPSILQAQSSQETILEARELLGENRDVDALAVLDDLVEKEPMLAAAHYYRGLALGRLQQLEDAQHAFLTAAGLSPGDANAHRFAAISSYQLGDMERAWQHAIVAARSGANMYDMFVELGSRTTPPPGWRDRLSSPLLFVQPPDLTGLLSSESFSFNTRVTGRDAPTNPSATVTNGDIPYDIADESPGGGMSSAADWKESTTSRVRSNSEQLGEMIRYLMEAVAHGNRVGLAPRADRASYFVQVEILELSGKMAGRLVGCELMPGGAGAGASTNLGDADVDTDIYEAQHPKVLNGNLNLVDSRGFIVYSTPLKMDNIASLADLHNRIDRYVDQLEEAMGAVAGER